MSYTYVGDHPRHLESGRPISFGDVVDSLEPEDARLSPWLVENQTQFTALQAPDPEEVT